MKRADKSGFFRKGHMRIEILHADALTPAGLIPDSHIVLEDGKVQRVAPWSGQPAAPEAEVIDAGGLLASPGWIDIQINGAFGKNFTDHPDTIWEVGAQLTRFGTTSFLPTIVSAPWPTYERAIQVLAEGPPADWRGARPLGLHFEGPFLNPEKKGAHDPAHLRAPDPDLVKGWSREKGVLLVTLAPELPRGLELARLLIERGVVLSTGHSSATYEEAEVAFAAGFSCGTHLYNAMSALSHRAPGLTGALLAHPEITAGLIVDGIHVHPGAVRLAWRSKGQDSLALVTDAVAGLGQSPGRYKMGNLSTVVDETSVRLEDGTLAGSILSQEKALQNLVSFCGISLEQAIPALAQTPARLLGMTTKGRLAVGAVGDLTLVTPNGEVQYTIIEGRIAHQGR